MGVWFKKFRRRQHGAPMLEYAILLSLLSGMTIGAVKYVGHETGALYRQVASHLGATESAAGSTPVLPVDPPTTDAVLSFIVVPQWVYSPFEQEPAMILVYNASPTVASPPLGLGNFALDNSLFSLAPFADLPCQGPLAPGGYCAMTVSFKTPLNGEYSTTLTIHANGATAAYPMTATAQEWDERVAFVARSTQTVLNGPTRNNEARYAYPATEGLTQAIVENKGFVPSQDLTGRFSLSDARWSIVQNGCNKVLESGDQCRIDLRFVDPTPGDVSGESTLTLAGYGSTVLYGQSTGRRLGFEVVGGLSGNANVLRSQGTYRYVYENTGNVAGIAESVRMMQVVNGASQPAPSSAISIESTTCLQSVSPSGRCEVVVRYEDHQNGVPALYYLMVHSQSLGINTD